MFTTVKEPAKEYKSCSMCPHYSSRLLKSGMNPIREHVCGHPEFVGNKEVDFKIFGLKSNGRKIGNDNKTPKWCPFLPENGKRFFKQISPSECIELLRRCENSEINPRDWKVKLLDKEVYEEGGYEVYSKKNYFKYFFDFGHEDISVWDSKIKDYKKDQFSIKESYEIVEYLNSKNIFFKWQNKEE